MDFKALLVPLLLFPFPVESMLSCSPSPSKSIPVVSEKVLTDLSTKTLGIIYNLEVIDGDTIKAKWTVPYPQLETIYLRINGMDTPELFHPKCEKERELAQQTKVTLQALVSEGVDFDILSWDKYGGRILVKLETRSGKSIPEILISMGLAVPYFGEKKSKDWCSE